MQESAQSKAPCPVQPLIKTQSIKTRWQQPSRKGCRCRVISGGTAFTVAKGDKIPFVATSSHLEVSHVFCGISSQPK